MAAADSAADIGAILRDARERVYLAQDELALRLGVSRSAVQAWETGTAEPRLRHRRLIDEFLAAAVVADH